VKLERELEPREILRRARIDIVGYMRELREHRRAVKPRLAIARRWVRYYEDLARIRPLTAREARALDRHRANVEVYERRLNLFRAMARLARARTRAERLEREIELHMAKARYYEAKMEVVTPEEAEEIRKRLLPPAELYRRWREVMEEIGEMCKRFFEAKYRLGYYAIAPAPARYMAIKSLGEALRDAYARAAETAEEGREFPAIAREWLELKRR